jgi:predicted transcriptional regulator
MYRCDTGLQGTREFTAMLERCIACMHGIQQTDIVMQLALVASEKSAQIAAAVQNGQRSGALQGLFLVKPS